MELHRVFSAAALVALAGLSSAQSAISQNTSLRLGAMQTEAQIVDQRADGATILRTQDERAASRPGSPARETVELVVLPEFVVETTGGLDPDQIALDAGVALVRTLSFGDRTFAEMRARTGAEAIAIARALDARDDIPSASPLVEGVNAPMGVMIPSDARLGDQWHHQNTGQSGGTPGEDVNTLDAWALGFSGVGSTILIIDNGVQTNHPDVAPNFNLAGSFDIDQGINDPNPKVLNDRHGTACAGKAAAANDGSNTVGAAFNAEISGWRVDFPSSTSLDFAQAYDYRMDINEITNNSYGPRDSSLFVAPLSASRLAALENSIENGRGGLGTIHVKSAGNGLGFDDDSNFDGLSNSRYAIAVSATDHNGNQSSYSEPGANILVNAPSSGAGVGTVTSDVEGLPGIGDGYTPGDFTTTGFGGTSSAGPLVAGVVALVLEANPNLTWRDVQYVLALSAERNDPSDPEWTLNGAGHWVNHKYGFGRVDALGAVQLAQTWTNVGADTAEEYTFDVPAPVAIPEDGLSAAEIGVTVIGSQIGELEFVEFTVDLAHTWQGDVDITLVSPDGTESFVTGRNNDSSDGYTYTFTSRRHLGERANGVWTLRFLDTFPAADTGSVNGASLRLTGLPGNVSTCDADFDGDGDVDFGDFGAFVTAFDSLRGDDNYLPEADFDNDGDVDFGDFGAFVTSFDRTDC